MSPDLHERLALPPIPRSVEIISPEGRIRLARLTLDHVAELFALIDRNREWLSQFGEPTSANYPTEASLAESISSPDNPDKLRYVIRRRQGEVIGTINLRPDPDNLLSGEVGYYLGYEATGQGFATEAVRTLTRHAHTRLAFPRLWARVHPDNVASAAVLIRAGYTDIGMHPRQYRRVFEARRM
jgi:RimJ/RimL family protein N-acetyltransferase